MGLLRVVATSTVCIAFVATGAVAQSPRWETVRIATEGAYAPWNFSDASGKLDGFEIELANDLCRRMTAKCEIFAQDWDGIIPGLNAGRYDAIMASLSITDKRKEVIGFTTPYTFAVEAFGVAGDGPLAKLPGAGEQVDLTANEAKGKELIAAMTPLLKRKVLGVQASTTLADFADKYLKNVVEVREYKTAEQQHLDLASGRIDIVMEGVPSLTAALEKPDMSGLVLAGPRFSGGVFGPGVAAGLRKTDAELKAKFDAAIGAARADGTLSKLSVKWFKVDISPKQ